MAIEQHTYEVTTTEGIVYLVVDDTMSVEEEFELFKNDEVGEWAKKANIISYKKIN